MTGQSLAPLPPPPGKTPEEAVDAIAQAAKSSFAIGIRLLPGHRRAAMKAIYAYCRVVDDIADGDLPADRKLALLADWRDEIDRTYVGDPASAIGRALLGPIEDYDLPKSEFHMIAEGMEMDANGPIVAPTFERLLAYNRRVAGAVGLLSMRVFGAWRGEVSDHYALALGNALQLTNILRDVEEDAAAGRIYLTAECLAEAGIEPDPASLAAHPNLPAARACLAEAAREAYLLAEDLRSVHGRLRLIPALAMYGVYRAYFRRMEAAGWRPGPAFRMSRSEKLRHGLWAALTA